MPRRITYWVSTAVVTLALLGSLSYLTGSDQVVAGFAKAGYPQYLRIMLGVAKPVAAVILLIPGVPLLKEWAYVGVAISLVMATVSAYVTGEIWYMPLGLLLMTIASYVTRPAGRRLPLSPTAMTQ